MAPAPPSLLAPRSLLLVAVAAGVVGAGCGDGGPVSTVTVTSATTVTVTTTRTALAAPTTIAWPPADVGEATPILRTSSGNIECLVDTGNDFGVVCTAREHSWTLPPKPASCEFEWTDSVWLEPAGRPGFWCSSNAAFSGPNAYWPRYDFPYGSAVAGGGVRCASSEAGVRCTNRDGHGFTLSRERRVFF